MFILSVKANKKIFWLCVCTIILIIAAIIVMTSMGKSSAAMISGTKYSLNVSNNEQRVAFLKQFGWEVNAEPIEISDVTIPQTFNKVYENYNEIQKEQGLDLTKYGGKICKKWVYEITNYPEDTIGVRANLLIFDNKVIGGDISSVALDGFMFGFEGPKDVWIEDPECDTHAAETEAQPAKEVDVSQIPTNAWPTD